MASRIKELAWLMGKGWFGAVAGIALSIYGAVELVAASDENGWLWVALGLLAMTFVLLRLAYKAIAERDKARQASQPQFDRQGQGGNQIIVQPGGTYIDARQFPAGVIKGTARAEGETDD